MEDDNPTLNRADTNISLVETDMTDKVSLKSIQKIESKCTYEKGYITQEVFICKTCYKDKEEYQNSDSELNIYDEKVEPFGMCYS